MRPVCTLLLAVTTLLVLCDFARAHVTQVRPGSTALDSDSSSSSSSNNRFLRSYESTDDGEERGIGSALNKLAGLEKKANDFSQKDLMRALDDENFRAVLLKRWGENQHTVGHVQGKLQVDPFHPRYKQLLLDYMNIYKKTPASPASLTRRKKPVTRKIVHFE